MTYKVKNEDTLYNIAKRFGVSLDDLIAANPEIKDPNIIYPGQIINIPKKAAGKYQGDDCMCNPDKKMMEKVCLNIPYPEVEVERQNIKYAKMMMDVLADRESELTAIHTYLYYYTMLKNTKYEELADLLEAISIIEMKHMHDTMEFIKKLGCEPMYTNSRGRPWCAAYVNYELHNVCNLLMTVIQDEKNAYKLYMEMADFIKDKYLSAWLRRAAKDEAHHAKLFKIYYDKYCKPMG